MLDVTHLIGEVAAKNGIRLEPDDPAFALVTLNQLVLEETVNRVNEHVSAVLMQFTESLGKAERRAGAMLAQDVKSAAAEIRSGFVANSIQNKLAVREYSSDLQPFMNKWIVMGIISGVLLVGVGVVFGYLISGR